MFFKWWEYYALLRLRRKLPVLPIVVYLSPGTGGVVWETHTEAVFGETILTFRYRAVGVPDLKARDYRMRPNPLSPALSALMRSPTKRRVLRRLKTLRQRAIRKENPARQALLVRVIEKYLPLTESEQGEFDRLLAAPENQEVKQTMTYYEQLGYNRGIEQGIERGIEQGIEQGLLQGMRRLLLKQMQVRFGELPGAVRAAVEATTNAEQLDALTERVLTAPTLQDMGLFPAPPVL